MTDQEKAMFSIICALRDRHALSDIVELIRMYAALGGTRHALLNQLEKLRHEFSRDEIREDLTLEVMDVVVGFVSPGMKVWP